MENEKTRYDVLLAQLDYIKNGGVDKLFNPLKDGNDRLINKITTDLAGVCMQLNLIHSPCPDGYRLEDGMCVPNLTS